MLVTLLSRPGCHLCDDARAIVRTVCEEAGVRWEERDITDEPELLERWRDWVPVTLVDGHQHDVLRVSEQRLRRALGG